MTGVLYATLVEFKARLGIANALSDAALTDALEAASRDVDKDTGRRPEAFSLAGSATIRRYRTNSRISPGRDGDMFLTDDIGSTTGLLVETGQGTNWAPLVLDSDYITAPDNALADGYPIWGLLRPTGIWPDDGVTMVRVTARWGWPAVPAAVKQATLLRAHRLYRRKDSPEGVAGAADTGMVRVPRYDPDYDALLTDYVVDGFG